MGVGGAEGGQHVPDAVGAQFRRVAEPSQFLLAEGFALLAVLVEVNASVDAAGSDHLAVVVVANVVARGRRGRVR